MSVEETVVNGTKQVEEKVEDIAKEVVAAEKERVRVEIEATEKLILRDAETEFLRAQVQMRDLQTQMKEVMQKSEAASKKYSDQIEVLVKKYTIDKTKMIFDNVENIFKNIVK